MACVTFSSLILLLLTWASVHSRTIKEDIPDILIRNVKVLNTDPDSSTEASQEEPQGQVWSWATLGALGPDLSPNQGQDTPRSQPTIEGLQMEQLQSLIDSYGLHNLTSKMTGASSARFLLEMYHKLQEGEDLPSAAGYSYLDAAVLRADTVRSLPAKQASKATESDKKVTLTFDLSAISQREDTKRAELRIRPMRHGHRVSGLAEFRARVVVFDGEERVKHLTYYVTADKHTTDGFALLDLTHIIKDVVDAGYDSAKVEVTLKQLSSRGSRKARSRRSVAMDNQLPSSSEDAMLVVFTKDRHFFESFRYQATKKHLQYQANYFKSTHLL